MDWHPHIRVPAGFAKLTGTSQTWGYSTAPQREIDSRQMWYPQGRVLGGGSSINAMIYARGNARDYDGWAEAGCSSWSYRDVLPYFKRPEDNERFHNEYHGSGGPLGVSDPVRPLAISAAFVRAAQQAGLPYNPDFNGAAQAGCGYYQVTNRDARRCSGVDAFLRPAMARRNLTVETRTMATRVAVEKGRAVGVDYARRGQTAHVRAAREVIVSAGAIGSPKLLMLSGIGRGDDLKALGIDTVHDLPGVGQNLQDHFDVYVVSECRGDFSYDKVARPTAPSGPSCSTCCSGRGRSPPP